MAIRHYVLGVTPIQLVHKGMLKNRIADILIQNMDDTNVVYVLTAQTVVSATEGIVVPINGGTYRNDTIQTELWMAAAGANTDVRVDLDYVDKRMR